MPSLGGNQIDEQAAVSAMNDFFKYIKVVCITRTRWTGMDSNQSRSNSSVDVITKCGLAVYREKEVDKTLR